MSEADDRAETLAGAVYGTIVVAGVLAAADSYVEQPSALYAAVYAVATVLVLWLAEAWALAVGRRGTGAALGRSFVSSLRQRWPLAQSAAVPLIAVALARVFGSTHATAISVGVWTCVGLLVFWGAAIEVRERAPLSRIVGNGAACGVFGLIIIGLKAAVH